MNNKLSIITLFIALAALGFSYFRPSHDAARPETANEHVGRAKTLRCGYILYPPYLEKDAKTGNLKGVAFDIIEAIGKTWNRKIEWVEEIPIANEIPALTKTNIDAVCAITAAYDPNTYDQVSFSDYIFIVNSSIVARADEKRFNGPVHLDDIDKSDARFAGIDGDTTLLFAQMLAPHAKTVALPATAGLPQLFQEVMYRKADLVIVDSPIAHNAFMTNPGTFKILDVQEHLPTYAMQLVYAKKEGDLKETINEVIRYMKMNGLFDPILKKYDPSGRLLIQAK